MAHENLAPSALRLTIVTSMSGNAGEDLATFDAREYPDGTMVYVLQSRVLYQLDKASTLTADGTAIVTCVSGGRWIAMTSYVNTLYSYSARMIILSGTSTGALVQNTWTALPSATDQYAGAGSGVWAVSTTTGVLTYSGPTRNFLVIGSLTGAPGSGTTTNFGFSFSRSSAAAIGTTTDQAYEAQSEFAATEEGNLSFGAAYVATLIAGQTLQGCVRNIDGTEALSVLRYSLTILPAG